MRLTLVWLEILALSHTTAFVPSTTVRQRKEVFRGTTASTLPIFRPLQASTQEEEIQPTAEEEKELFDTSVVIQDDVTGQTTNRDVTQDEEIQAGEESSEPPKSKQQLYDEANMKKAIEVALSNGGERGETSAYPKPTAGAVLVAEDGTILGKGLSDYRQDCVPAVFADAGLEVTPLQEWCLAWPSSSKLRNALSRSTLYLTLEPTAKRHGLALPPMTQLIELSGVGRVVIGSPDPVPEFMSKGASTLHTAGIEAIMGSVLKEECDSLIELYSQKANSKLQRMARRHFKNHHRPLGFLHCSVVDSNNLEAFANHGNAFGKEFDGKLLSERNFGAYEIAPPPEVLWAESQNEEVILEDEDVDIFDLEFEEEDFQESLGAMPMMPWYGQVDAVVATFPKPGNGPVHDDSVSSCLNGLKWLATYGTSLPAGVERILVLDATDLASVPLTNDDPNLPKGVDVETFWAGEGRKPTRVLLRRGRSSQAQAAAKSAAEAAEAAAQAAKAATEAIETGDAESAAEAALAAQKAAIAATEMVQGELAKTLALKSKLTKLGATVETISGGDPVDVMIHLGKRNGYSSVVWRAGCWGNRGVQSILDGAFQWVSAHLAVDAVGGKFWQLMLAERAVQGACGPESRVKVFAAQDDISLEYCDQPEADGDCSMTVDGRPVRHVRLDCRVALVDPDRPREFVTAKTQLLDRKIIEEDAPWFL